MTDLFSNTLTNHNKTQKQNENEEINRIEIKKIKMKSLNLSKYCEEVNFECGLWTQKLVTRIKQKIIICTACEVKAEKFLEIDTSDSRFKVAF